ncbi:PAS domain S-box protein [Natrarchaeobius halalkaliphilus]|uniref:histidine kinase n=1 Tax=Natrarchaeobius halalkaliphilus TaxID=1679091 RepID=A0A3N6LZ64_9EURY|nr:histidine kinase N-terminal 7TM domain-containing protein [Natrarchaeobius halalkaliphilus]RQG88023.1 PAS domain S-box protein [Natrarchaeobius halalkaliphilus]
MTWQWTVYTLPLLLAFGLLCLVAVYLAVRWRQDEGVPGIALATGLVTCLAVTLGWYVLELSAVPFETKVLFNQLQYLGLAPLTAFMLAYVLVYIGRGDLLTPRTYAVLFVPPLLTILAVFTYDLHWQFWTDVAVDTNSTYAMLVNEHGTAYLGFFAYTAAYAFTSLGLLVRKAIDARGVHRRQICAMIVGILAPLTGGFVYVFGPIPQHYPTPTYVAFVVTAVAFSWPVFRLDLFGLVPIAHRTLLEQMDDGVVACDENGVIVTANEGAATMLGSTQSGMIGAHVEDVLVPLLDKRTRFEFEDETATTNETELDEDSIPEAAIGDGDGEWTATVGNRVIDVSVTRLRQSDQPVGRLVTLTDVTERHTRTQQLQSQNTYLDEFAEVVSHDIATPLGVIENRAQLIELTNDPEHVDDIFDSTERIQQLMDDLLELARQGRAIDEIEPTDLESIVRETWDGVDSEGAGLVVESSSRVLASRSRCRQLLENLLKNALIHGPGPQPEPAESDEVIGGQREGNSVASAERAADLTIRVGALPGGFYLEDDGVGIPEADRSTVFEQGYTDDPEGTGLGLAIVARIVDAHGWSIRATESESGGARFEVTDVETVSNEDGAPVATR